MNCIKVPSEQYHKIISGRGGKANLSPSKSATSSSKSKGSTPKRTAKSLAKGSTQSRETKKQKSDASKAPAKPKSLEQAFKNLTEYDLSSQLEQLKIWYPDSNLAWLKGVIIFVFLYLIYHKLYDLE